MFERFTDRARRVVVLAQEEARMLSHNYIGTEHILLGLIHEGEGVAATADNTITATLAPAPGGICTHDIVPHTTVFSTPERITKTAEVKVVMPDTTLTLPIRHG